MAKHVSELTLEELVKAGAEAAKQAAVRAAAAGLPPAGADVPCIDALSPPAEVRQTRKAS